MRVTSLLATLPILYFLYQIIVFDTYRKLLHIFCESHFFVHF